MQNVRSASLSALLYGTLHTPLAYSACSQTSLCYCQQLPHKLEEKKSLYCRRNAR